MLLRVSQGEEQQEREDLPGDSGTRKKDGTSLPQQNPSSFLYFNTHVPRASPCQAPPPDTDQCQAGTERSKQTPRSLPQSGELASLCLCRELMEDGVTSSAVGGRAGAREEGTCELDFGRNRRRRPGGQKETAPSLWAFQRHSK